MSELDQLQRNAQAARGVAQEIEDSLYGRRNRLRQKEEQLAQARGLGAAGSIAAASLQQEIRTLQAQTDADQEALGAARDELQRFLHGFELLQRPWELVERLDDNLPFLLFPVRVETRFMPGAGGGPELWVRIFPDDVAVHTHEEALTADELAAAQTYWRELWSAAREANPAERENLKKGAWRVLAGAYGGNRAAWIARQTEPETLDVPESEALIFPDFDPEDLKPESWSRAPRCDVMPDRFVVMTYTGDMLVHRVLGNIIPDPLFVGPDPLRPEAEFRQADGELVVGDDIAWIYDFDRAVAAGMGVRIPLDDPVHARRGFDRILVLGLRLSAGAAESQALLESLLDNHHYAADGLSLLPQGTPTNNTRGDGAGYSSVDPGAETSFSVETGEPLFEPTDDLLTKSDGQRLTEALGIDPTPLQHIQHAGARDAQEAMVMNRALWPGTLGYYLDELLALNPADIRRTRDFFTRSVSGRGPLPAIRVGTQPYGLLLTSDFRRWQWSRENEDPDELPFLNQLYEVIVKADATWREKAAGVAHVGAPGDPYENLLRMLGLHATSAEHYRRHAVGKEYIWNYEVFNLGTFVGRQIMTLLAQRARDLVQELGFTLEAPPRLFDLAFFLSHDLIIGPLVDDIPPDQEEKWSETRQLPVRYRLPDPEAPEAAMAANYIGWLAHSPFDSLKQQRFLDMEGESQPVPRPLLYRMLHGALLQATYDATMRVYTGLELVPRAARREVELSNVRAERTLTRWEFMEADVSRVAPGLSQVNQSFGHYLQTETGLSQPQAAVLRETREALASLAALNLPTARLERLFVEHLDACSYRLDAWQMGCFYRRLAQQRYPRESQGAFAARRQGVYLGAFGWLEDVRPGGGTVPANLEDVPASLHDPQLDGELYEQPGNGGFIHGPSLNHAVAAAVLRNAYLTHVDTVQPEKMAVNLSSERVRTAVAFLEGVRNGQELGALLGYQFERGLHDRHGDPSLNQYIPPMRQAYPLVADKITPDPEQTQIERKEARNVFDGYALVEAAFLRESPLSYPYNIEGLPAADSVHGQAIREEVGRMADSLDAIADLALAEGVYQVTQGNYERAGAMMKALGEGGHPPEPEIADTPRSGVAITQRVALHLPPDADGPPWPVPPAGGLTERARVEPGLNRWLADLLPLPDKFQYAVQIGEAATEARDLGNLGLQPIDLIYLINDELADETTELESRILYEERHAAGDDSLAVSIRFMEPTADPDGVNLFALLPLLRYLRVLVADSRPLTALDFILPGEANTNPADNPNPQGYELDELKGRMQPALARFDIAVTTLGSLIPLLGPDGTPDLASANVEQLRDALRALADFGVPDAFPRSAAGDGEAPRRTLVDQADSMHEVGMARRDSALVEMTQGDNSSLSAAERTEHYRAAAAAVFGPAFNLIPTFTAQNGPELQAAVAFREAPPDAGLTRFHADNPFVIEEWLQGVTPVREQLGVLQGVGLLGAAFRDQELHLRPLQLPHRETGHWVAVPYPEAAPDDPAAFIPQGEFLSLVQALPDGAFDPTQPQRGLLVDEWTEIIPNRQETTGIAVQYNQPSAEPPQALLLALTPQVTGAWSWDKLVGILQDTLERAKRRGVEPDLLGDTPYAHLLPAVMTAVTKYPFATISTDLVYETAMEALQVAQEDE